MALSQFTQQQAEAAFLRFHKNILPAKLVQSVSNGVRLSDWVEQNLKPQPQTVLELVVALEKAAKAIPEQLRWVVPPAKIKNMGKDGVQVEQHISPQELAAERAKNDKAVAAAAAEKKAEEQAGNQLNSMIHAFSPPSKRGGVDYGLQAAQQKIMRDHVEKELGRGVKNTELVVIIREHIARIYKELERQIAFL